MQICAPQAISPTTGMPAFRNSEGGAPCVETRAPEAEPSSALRLSPLFDLPALIENLPRVHFINSVFRCPQLFRTCIDVPRKTETGGISSHARSHLSRAGSAAVAAHGPSLRQSFPVFSPVLSPAGMSDFWKGPEISDRPE